MSVTNAVSEQEIESPLISIIVPVYNTAEYLPQCVDSICAQTYRNIEIILVDDGSKDNSGDICDSYAEKDERIRVIHKSNGGQGEARNFGLDVCHGEYIGVVDSDDYIDSQMVETLYRASEAYEADIVCCQIARVVTEREYKIEMADIRIYNAKYEMIHALLMSGKRLSDGTGPCNKLYKRKIFAQLRFPLGMKTEDTYIIIDIIRNASRIVELPDTLYYYRLRLGSTTLPKHWDAHMGDLLTAYRHVYDVVAREYPDALPIAEKRLTWAYCASIYRGAGTVDYLMHVDEIRKWKKYLRATLRASFCNPYNGIRQIIHILMAAYLPSRFYSRVRFWLVNQHRL